MASDETIGSNLQRLRDTISQQELAERMRERGWKWSQATVWSIEKGERPLRLAEASDVLAVLGYEYSLEAFTSAEPESIVRAGVKEVERLRLEAVRALDEYNRLRLELAFAADDALVNDATQTSLGWQARWLMGISPIRLALAYEKAAGEEAGEDIDFADWAAETLLRDPDSEWKSEELEPYTDAYVTSTLYRGDRTTKKDNMRLGEIASGERS